MVRLRNRWVPGSASSPSRPSTRTTTNPIRELLERFQQRRSRLTVPQFTVLTGLLVIAVGTLLMALPVFSSEQVGLWEAMFTVVSAITVTGLSVVDVGQELTFPGQVLLALLILTGGLGLMAITTFLQGFVQRGSRLRRRLDRGRAMDEFGVGGIGDTFHSILITAAWVIGMGTLVLYTIGFRDIPVPRERLWASLFHCISAYNNAGFGLWSDNLVGYRASPVVNLVIMVMIVSGGIGYRVTNDLWQNRFKVRLIRSFSLQTRLVLRWTIGLILIGAAGMLFTEHFTRSSGLTPLPWWEELQVVFFQSVSTRTAGFNTVPLSVEVISEAGLLLMMTLQVLAITIFALFLVYRLTGRNYDAAVMTAGFVGLGLGATPVALANMDAITRNYGPSIKAFIVIPIIGALFIDLLNAGAINFFIALLMRFVPASG